MRFTFASFTGYIGFYNGMGIEKLSIDFTKCKNNIVAIHGMNGCGKTTLLSALSIFPDPTSAFMNGRNAEKILRLVNDSDIYDIKIVSDVDTRGQRKQTKAYISKNFIELNSNGNITSYKEIVFSEFDLDPNYISLSKLSSDDKGLGSKTPAERKKFVSSIIESLDIYNSIYKTLNKKSLIFRSHINTLHTKIQNIGMKDLLEANLRSLQIEYTNISARIEELNTKIIAIQAKSSIDSEEQNYISEVNTRYNTTIREIDSIEAEMNVLLNKFKIKKENIFNEFNRIKENLETHKSRVDSVNSSWLECNRRLAEINKVISDLEAEYTILTSETDTSIETFYNETCDKVSVMIKDLKRKLCNDDIEIDIFNIFSMITVFENTIKVYEQFIKMIDTFYSNCSNEDLEHVISSNLFEESRQNNLNLAKAIARETELKQKIKDLDEEFTTSHLLDKKPDNCKNRNCFFIKKAWEINEKYIPGDLEKNIRLEHVNLENTQKSIRYYSDLQLKYELWNNLRVQLNSILDYFFANIGQISPMFDPFSFNRDKMLEAIGNHNSFNDYRDPRNLVDHLNFLYTLKAEMGKLEKMSADYATYKEKIKHLESTNAILKRNKEEALNLAKDINYKSQQMKAYQDIISSSEAMMNHYTKLSNLYTTYLQKIEESNKYKEKLDEFNQRHSRAMESFKFIDGLREELEQHKAKLIPINSDIQRISGQLTLLESYYIDYNQYKEKYNMIEILKKYCSPTGGGIQTIFMQLYLSQTLELSNQILQMLFGGEYKLLDFVINQNEFKIPFVGSGLPVDDISSGSRSQVSIMGMIINLVLYHQASTKFNIARLDEVDDSLDIKNRLEFFNVLRNILPILGFEQLICISHSIEADTSAVDIIKLKTYPDANINLLGNIIFDYEKDIIGKTLN